MRLRNGTPAFVVILHVWICFALTFVHSETLDSGKTLSERITQAREYVRTNIATQAPGVSVALGINGKIEWAEGFGYADLAKKTPVTSKTLFRIGSVSKPLTAAGLMLLVEKGKLDLDADIHAYLPDFPHKEQMITPRQLAGHLAGIRHYKGREVYLNRPYASVAEGLKIFEDDPLLSIPGEKFAYSSYGWNLISAVMEKAAKQDFLTYMDAAVFHPLNLKNTIPDFAQKQIPARTRFYARRKDGKFVEAAAVDNSYKWASGGFLSTPEDLVVFGMAHLQPGFLQHDSLNSLFTSQKTANGRQTGYGIGWQMLHDACGHRVYFHTGASIGGTSVLFLHPESRVALAITANCTDADLNRVKFESLAELFSPSG